MLVFSFFFTSVAANAIATTARNPVSGMTMLTIMISSVVLLKFGLSGPTGDVLRHGDRRHGLHGAVGLGPDRSPTSRPATGWARRPQVQERVKFLGVIAGLGRRRPDHRDARRGCTTSATPPTARRREDPRGAAGLDRMKALVQSFMNREPVAWAALRRRLDDRGRPGDAPGPGADVRAGHVPSARAELPALVGGYLHHLVTKKAAERGRRDRGERCASAASSSPRGMMAGGALGGVFGAGLRLIRDSARTGSGRRSPRPRRRSRSWCRSPGFARAWSPTSGSGANRKPARIEADTPYLRGREER